MTMTVDAFFVQPAAISNVWSNRSGSRICSVTRSDFSLQAYIPDGLTEDQWAAIKDSDNKKLKKGQLGKLGTTKFESRSLTGWMLDGGKHLFPKDPKKSSRESLPYMQRKGGSWKESPNAKANKADEDYEGGGEKKWQSASFWFGGSGVPGEHLF